MQKLKTNCRKAKIYILPMLTRCILHKIWLIFCRPVSHGFIIYDYDIALQPLLNANLYF